MPAAPRVDTLTPLAVFGAAFTALVLGTTAAIDGVPVLAARAAEVAMGERPPADDYYLASDIGAYVDHHVLYPGLDREKIVSLKPEAVFHLLPEKPEPVVEEARRFWASM